MPTATMSMPAMPLSTTAMDATTTPATTMAMHNTVAPLAVIQMEGTPWHKVHQSHDLHCFVANLNAQQPLRACVVLTMLPCSQGDAAEKVEARARQLDLEIRNGWISAPFPCVLQILSHALSAEETASCPSTACGNGDVMDCDVNPSGGDMDADSATDEPLDASPASPVSTPAPPVEDVDPALWAFLCASTAKEADKAVQIRDVLTQRMGKAQATKLLACTKARVAKDGQGAKNRVLKAGGSFLKLRKA